VDVAAQAIELRDHDRQLAALRLGKRLREHWALADVVLGALDLDQDVDQLEASASAKRCSTCCCAPQPRPLGPCFGVLTRILPIAGLISPQDKQ
jgi:hypothetical protein